MNGLISPWNTNRPVFHIITLGRKIVDCESSLNELVKMLTQ
jgi:hypothetical protein